MIIRYNLIKDFLLFITILAVFHLNAFIHLLYIQLAAYNNLLSILFLPLLLFIFDFIVPGLKKLKLFLFCSSIFLIFVKSLYLFIYFRDRTAQKFYFHFDWINLSVLKIDFTFFFDPLSVVMVLVISFISFLVHIYSLDYMAADKNIVKFFSYLNLFTFFMIVLVIAGNVLVLFLGWEGVGMTSYLLINFWYTRFEANKSSLKAIVMNKVGDIALLFFLTASYYYFGTLEILEMKSAVYDLSVSAVLFLSILLFIAAIAKSAQLGLHTWLPDAMEGPTPVSALLHAATMVTAGVYLLVRFSFLIELAPQVLNLIALIGSLTALFGSLLALVQVDIKKIIAFSTLSQLGYMFTAIGLTGYQISMFHLITHAGFKALLFLCAGVIIHTLNNEQDIRKYGGLLNLMPLLYTFMALGFLSLSGFPFFAGFYSKDLILELVYTLIGFPFYSFIASTLSFATFLTTFYSLRTVYYTFLATPNFNNFNNIKNIHDVNFIQFIVLFPLAVCSVGLGYILFSTIVGSSALVFWKNSLGSFFPLLIIETTLGFSTKIFPVVLFIASCLTFYEVFYGKHFNLPNLNFLTKFLYRKFYYDILLNRIVAKPFFNSVYDFTFYTVDRGLLQNFIESISNKALTRLESLFKQMKDETTLVKQLNVTLAAWLIPIFFMLAIIIVGIITK